MPMAKRTKTSRKKPPADETKEQKFVRVVQPRITKALRSVRLIGNCAGSGYSYTPQQVSLIVGALRRAVDSLEGQFLSKKATQEEFTFSK